jgi:hypothetical protein
MKVLHDGERALCPQVLYEFCLQIFLAITLFWELVWYFTFDQKLVTNGRRNGRFPLIRGRIPGTKILFQYLRYCLVQASNKPINPEGI